jgi:hypothetical protein
VKDQFGNPAFTPLSAGYQIDVGTAPVPTPLTPEAPVRSLIYDTGLTGYINLVNDRDTFTVNHLGQARHEQRLLIGCVRR